jgi:hypothetical protein
MGATYYGQGDNPGPTMTVGQLIEKLRAFDPNELVVFRSPLYGSFGSNTAYTVEDVERETLPRREYHIAAHTHEDEETGETYEVEAETQVWNAWTGIVIR